LQPTVCGWQTRPCRTTQHGNGAQRGLRPGAQANPRPSCWLLPETGLCRRQVGSGRGDFLASLPGLCAGEPQDGKIDRLCPTPRRPTSRPAARHWASWSNIIACSEDYPRCIQAAAKLMCAASRRRRASRIHPLSKRKILARTVAFLLDVIEVIEFHHDVAAGCQPAGHWCRWSISATCLCRLRDLDTDTTKPWAWILRETRAWSNAGWALSGAGNHGPGSLYDGHRWKRWREIVAVVDAVFNRRNPMVVRAGVEQQQSS